MLIISSFTSYLSLSHYHSFSLHQPISLLPPTTFTFSALIMASCDDRPHFVLHLTSVAIDSFLDINRSGEPFKLRGAGKAKLLIVHGDPVGHYSTSSPKLYCEIVTETDGDRSRSLRATEFKDDGVHLRHVQPETLEIVFDWVYDQRLYKRVRVAGSQHVKPEQSRE